MLFGQRQKLKCYEIKGPLLKKKSMQMCFSHIPAGKRYFQAKLFLSLYGHVNFRAIENGIRIVIQVPNILP